MSTLLYDPPETLEPAQETWRLLSAIYCVPGAAVQAVLKLRLLDGLPLSEAAARLQISYDRAFDLWKRGESFLEKELGAW